ncbi:putative indole-3-pyruvate monooxygenase YUCCA11 [Dichanthelium oligosanthes]|uniref:indole-3-pyruvate monooxygenase n=1 Tax=Dichanthelium oligosanthes TaxID=888268 RepID=A0A1E5V351_9POAL|nr:putative indole-3-pyruvate monooxygenase YUCCA11 [Dichanthelium oligosanthes]
MASNGAAAQEVIIVGAGPSGLAASACLSMRGVSSLVLERDDCVGSLWRKRAYDRLTLHLPKHASALPHAPHPAEAPNYLPRDDFVRYLDGYADRFGVRARLRREARAARFDAAEGRWHVAAVDLDTGDVERYVARYLVVATGKYDEKFVPEVPGLEGFPGKVVHASEYRTAEGMKGKSVLVVGCGNSGMEIALDLAEAGAITSIVVRSELHILTKWILNLGIMLRSYLPVLPIWMIDKLVLPTAMTSMHGNVVEFADGRRHPFDAIVFATGYRSAIKRWLQDGGDLIGDNGILKQCSPKAENGLYYAGLSGRGIFGSSMDAVFIADDISKKLLPQAQGQGKPEHNS